jgi:hypothetical protein
MDVYEHTPSAIHDTGHINTPTTIDIHDTIMLIIFGRSCNIPATYTQFLASILCIHCRTQAEWVGGGMWELSFWSDYNSKCTGQRGSIATGWTHIVALKRDGTVVAWGLNSDNQTNVPSGLTGVVAIAAGGAQSIALKNDGTLVKWGCNCYAIPAINEYITAVTIGQGFTAVLTSSGRLISWGTNQLNLIDVPIYYTSAPSS